MSEHRLWGGISQKQIEIWVLPTMGYVQAIRICEAQFLRLKTSIWSLLELSEKTQELLLLGNQPSY